MCGVLSFFSMIPMMMFISLIAIASYAFTIMMIIDCYKRDFKDRDTWMIILIIGLLFQYGVIASIIYYFVVKKELDKNK